MEQYQVSLESPIEVVGLDFMVSAWQLKVFLLPKLRIFYGKWKEGQSIIDISSSTSYLYLGTAVIGENALLLSSDWSWLRLVGGEDTGHIWGSHSALGHWPGLCHILKKIIIRDKQKPSLSTWVFLKCTQ